MRTCPYFSGYYCSGGAYTERPTVYPDGSERYTLNDTICPIYSVNETGDVCSPGKSVLSLHFFHFILN